jgi:predicted Zn-dependent protease
MKYDEQILLKGALKVVAVLLFAPLCVFAQSDNDLARLVHDIAARLKSPPDFEQYEMPDFTVEINSKNEINASAYATEHKISVNKGLAQAFYNAPGELAFVIAHEVGHIQDAGCQARGLKLRLSGAALQRMCEAAADEIGLQYLMAAGYNWWDSAGAMGRLMMADGNQNSVLGIIVGRFTSDHPVSVDRIHKLAEAAQRTCNQRPELCAQ